MKTCLVCKGTLIWQANMGTTHVCSRCGIIYAKLPDTNAELSLRDHRHEGFFPVGEPIEPEMGLSDKRYMQKCIKDEKNKIS